MRDVKNIRYVDLCGVTNPLAALCSQALRNSLPNNRPPTNCGVVSHRRSVDNGLSGLRLVVHRDRDCSVIEDALAKTVKYR